MRHELFCLKTCALIRDNPNKTETKQTDAKFTSLLNCHFSRNNLSKILIESVLIRSRNDNWMTQGALNSFGNKFPFCLFKDVSNDNFAIIIFASEWTPSTCFVVNNKRLNKNCHQHLYLRIRNIILLINVSNWKWLFSDHFL